MCVCGGGGVMSVCVRGGGRRWSLVQVTAVRPAAAGTAVVFNVLNVVAVVAAAVVATYNAAGVE